MKNHPIPILPLGQSGFRLGFPGAVVYIDPYLSDRVAELYGEDLRRLRPAPVAAAEVSDADWVLVTHAHEDHCDPATLLPLAEASPRSRIVGPPEVVAMLQREGLPPSRLQVAADSRLELGDELEARPVPAAHPRVERDREGRPRCLGYVLRSADRRFYHSGDTSACPEVVEAARSSGPLEVAFLPVNEANHYRDRRGIVGNMSVREAFAMAEELGVETLVPIHWDLFAPNSVFPEEILLLHRKLAPPFRLLLDPTEL
ncbi:MAG: MBL fold metallo-hydrolase [Holophagales bacterium]|nr:MBL fold metallo-hydrolase [Holophagales bacterium]